MRKVLKYYKEFPKYEYKQFRSEISWAEYVLWWIVRVLMIYAFYQYLQKTDTAFIYKLMILGNFTATFTVFLGRLIFTKFIFLGRLPYSLQRYITVSVLGGSFFGQYLGYYGKIQNYDKWLHLLVGFAGVFIGYHLLMCMKHNNKQLTPFIASYAGFGFASFIAVIWEIFEFLADYYIVGSSNQNYGWTPPENMLFYKIFGMGVQNAGQIAVYDTMFDIMMNELGAVIGAVVIWPYVKREIRRFQEGRKKTPDMLRWEKGQDNIIELEPEREQVLVK